MKYQIVLTSVQWDADYQNARRFGSRAAQEAYFDVANKFTATVPVRNLDYGNFTRLSVLVKTGQAGIGDIMSANYAIIKDITVANSPKYWYYFITNATFDSVDQTRLELQMDVIQSYYIDMTFNESMIERAHLGRWDTSGYFSKDINSWWLTRDELKDLPKRISTMTSAVVSPFAPNHEVSKWLDANVYGWIYVYMDAGTYGEEGNRFNEQLKYILSESAGSTRIETPYIVLTAPLMKDVTHAVRIGATNLNVNTISSEALFNFIQSYAANIYAIKLSPYTPFDSNVNYSFSGIGDVNNLYLNLYGTAYEHLPQVHATATSHVAHVRYQRLIPEYLTKTFDLPQAVITKTGISTYAKDLYAIPKLYNSDYCGLKISYCGNEYNFDVQKIWHSVSANATSVNFKFFEVLTPEIAPAFITLDVDGTGIYYKPYENKIGYLAQNDLSIPYSKNQLDVFLANNKNFFLQKQAQYTNQRAQRAVGGISNAFAGMTGAAMAGTGGNTAGAVTSGVGAIGSIITNALSSELQIAYDKQATNYSLDNMEAGVDALANSNSNPFFNLGVSKLAILIETTDGLSVDVGRAAEDMHENGVIVNRMGNIKSFDNIRSKWNYVKAYLEVIKTPVKIPNEVRSKIKQIFRNGIRFWNTDTWDFEQTNLEN